VVECKHWASSVTKEKVLALIAITQDIGADKGILLSEVGYQSGAVRMAKNTNILLTSLADLKEEINSAFAETAIANLHWRIRKVTDQLWEVHKEERDGYGSTPAFSESSRLIFLEMALKDALVNRYPTVYAIGPSDSRLSATNFDELIQKGDELVRSVETFAVNYKKQRTSPE
jgi:Restriction endonuclease